MTATFALSAHAKMAGSAFPRPTVSSACVPLASAAFVVSRMSTTVQAHRASMAAHVSMGKITTHASAAWPSLEVDAKFAIRRRPTSHVPRMYGLCSAAMTMLIPLL